MGDPKLSKEPIARTGMLIRKPVAEVFSAFTEPEATTHFWFTKSSGPLRVGEPVTWEWEMYGASGDVVVQAFEPDRRLLLLDLLLRLVSFDNPSLLGLSSYRQSQMVSTESASTS